VLGGLLAGGLADIDTCGGPTFNGTGTPVCSQTLTDPTTAFRIGTQAGGFDGLSVPVPPATNNPIPLIPQGSSLTRSFGTDPFLTAGYAHTIDFTVQHVLPHNLFLEVGYIGRFSRNLTNGEQLNAPDLKQKDPASGQLYAQAFDAISNAFLAGTTASPQPFFENNMVTSGPNQVCTVGTCTATAQLLLPSVGPGDFGFFDYLMNLPGVLGPASAYNVPTSNNQIFELGPTTDGAFDDYNAGFVSLRKAMSHGLQFQFNYTWSHAIGNQGTNQQYIYSSQDPYNYGLDKSSSGFDHRQVANATWFYELPFGKGKMFSAGNSLMDRIIGGWTTGGIFTYYTGTPACAINDASNFGSFFETGCAFTTTSLPSWGKNYNVTGSGGIATSGNINVFANPVAVYNSLLFPQISAAAAPGYHISYDQMHGFGYWNFDLSLNKKFAITERVGVNIGADAFNVFNHTTFNGPSLDLLNPSAFGVITSQYAPGISPTGARTLQLGARVEF